jgi:addiction module RelB/DinJ family antitoxin
MKDSMIRARTTKGLKEAAEKILRALGVTPSQAINMFYTQIVLHESIPFTIDLEKDDVPENYIRVKDDKHLRSLLGLKDV